MLQLDIVTIYSEACWLFIQRIKL